MDVDCTSSEVLRVITPDYRLTRGASPHIFDKEHKLKNHFINQLCALTLVVID